MSRETDKTELTPFLSAILEWQNRHTMSVIYLTHEQRRAVTRDVIASGFPRMRIMTDDSGLVTHVFGIRIISTANTSSLPNWHYEGHYGKAPTSGQYTIWSTR